MVGLQNPGYLCDEVVIDFPQLHVHWAVRITTRPAAAPPATFTASKTSATPAFGASGCSLAARLRAETRGDIPHLLQGRIHGRLQSFFLITTQGDLGLRQEGFYRIHRVNFIDSGEYLLAVPSGEGR